MQKKTIDVEFICTFAENILKFNDINNKNNRQCVAVVILHCSSCVCVWQYDRIAAAVWWKVISVFTCIL